MASIKKLANGTYQATIYLGRDSNGKQIRKYVTRDSLKECKNAAREIEQDHVDGNFVDISNIKFSKWADEWLELNKLRLSPSTYASYKMYVDKHFKPYYKAIKVAKFNEIIVKRYIAFKLQTLSPTTVRKHIYVLSAMLDDVLKQKNPCKNIDKPSPAVYDYHIITDEEFTRIWDFFKGKPYEVIILLAALCGMRRGEIYALTWNDVNFDKGEIRVRKAVTMDENKEYVEKGPKSKNGYRDIAAPPEIFELLKKRRAKVKVFDANDYIFKSRPDTLTGWFARCMDKIEMPYIRFHDLRHYHATWLYKNGIPDLFAAQRLGDDLQTIKKVYQHIGDDTKKELNEKIIKGLSV